MILEICCNSVQSAVNAQEAGAHRIELCAELAVGGITPSFGLINEVLKRVNIPVFVLIRPRSGHFTYSDAEFHTMKQDIELCRELGCQGIVSGVLKSNNTIDAEKTQELVEISNPLPFTFHRAFDWTPDPFQALKQLMAAGVDRILTSGQESSAKNGLQILKQLQLQAGEQLTILPGGGINADNASHFKQEGFREIHCSASVVQLSNMTPKVSMNSDRLFGDTAISYSDKDTIKAILNSIRNEK